MIALFARLACALGFHDVDVRIHGVVVCGGCCRRCGRSIWR